MNDDEARALGERWIHAGGRLLPGMLLLYVFFRLLEPPLLAFSQTLFQHQRSLHLDTWFEV